MTGISAVVLTYNRRDLLRQCLDALLAQSVEIDKIIVIDNGGTDGSTEMMRAHYPDVEVCRLAVNTGAAGGFNMATRLAIAGGADQVWLMDDDVIPEPDALEHLVAGAATMRERGSDPPFMLSLARAPNGMLTNVPDIDRSVNAFDYANWPLQLERGLAPVRRATFVSILFPRQIFATHGYPLGSMFIWGEDSEFTWRVSKDQPGYLVARSEVTHVRAQPGMLDIRSEAPGPRLGWHRFLVRNTIYNLRTHQSRRALVQYTRATAHRAFRLALDGKLQKAGILAKGIVEGFVFKPDEARFAGAFEQAGIEFITRSLQARIAFGSAKGAVASSGPLPDPIPASTADIPAHVMQLGS